MGISPIECNRLSINQAGDNNESSFGCFLLSGHLLLFCTYSHHAPLAASGATMHTLIESCNGPRTIYSCERPPWNWTGRIKSLSWQTNRRYFVNLPIDQLLMGRATNLNKLKLFTPGTAAAFLHLHTKRTTCRNGVNAEQLGKNRWGLFFSFSGRNKGADRDKQHSCGFLARCDLWLWFQ